MRRLSKPSFHNVYVAYFSLFCIAFASATLLPGGSEAFFLYLLNESLNPLTLLCAATLGNTSGAFVNFVLGKYALDFALKKGYMKAAHLQKASSLFTQYGAWTLLFSWLPIIGDSFNVCCGYAAVRLAKIHTHRRMCQRSALPLCLPSMACA